MEDEAAIVRRIFYSMLSGSSAKAIGDSLEKDNIAPPGTAKSWTPAAILRMLKNEVYAGDVLRQKTYVADFITKTAMRMKVSLEPALSIERSFKNLWRSAEGGGST